MSSTRREPSQRQAARERYLASAQAAGLDVAVAAAAVTAPAAPSLTERVRALFEGSVVPVREIARLVGVAERTIYRYARKLRWKPRVGRLAPRAGGRCSLLVGNVRTLYEDAHVPVREVARLAGVCDVTIYNHARKLGWRRRGQQLAKGAGGRFIARADAGLPHAHGLKALDPAGARRAAELCARAGALADEAGAAVVAAAQARAARQAAESAARAGARASDQLMAALDELAWIRARVRTQAPGARTDAGAARFERLAAQLAGAILAQLAG